MIVAVRNVVHPAIHRRTLRKRIRSLTQSSKHQSALTHISRSLFIRLSGMKELVRASVRSRKRIGASTEHEVLAMLLEHVGHELRLGASLHAALATSLTRHRVASLEWLFNAARNGEQLSESIIRYLPTQEAGQRSDLDFVLRTLAAAADGADAVHAVESGARTLRSTAAILADSQAAVAHTRASINVLTWVPVAVAAWLAARDPDVRQFFLSRAGFICLLLGMCLNWVGRYLVRRITDRASRVVSEIPDFIDLVSVHLRAGKPPALAFVHASEFASGAIRTNTERVVEALRGGERFVDALFEHRHDFGLRAQPLVDALIDTERDGLPPHRLFDRLADEAKSQRRRDADQRIRALPVRLTLPLVGCVLPAYVLLGVVPLLAGQLLSVGFDPLPTTKG
jgi:Flp pilus assembly protein TadB